MWANIYGRPVAEWYKSNPRQQFPCDIFSCWHSAMGLAWGFFLLDAEMVSNYLFLNRNRQLWVLTTWFWLCYNKHSQLQIELTNVIWKWQRTPVSSLWWWPTMSVCLFIPESSELCAWRKMRMAAILVQLLGNKLNCK